MVVDCAGLLRASACSSFEVLPRVAGLLLTNTSSFKHELELASVIRSTCGLRVLGFVPRAGCQLRSRRLGVVSAYEASFGIKA